MAKYDVNVWYDTDSKEMSGENIKYYSVEADNANEAQQKAGDMAQAEGLKQLVVDKAEKRD